MRSWIFGKSKEEDGTSGDAEASATGPSQTPSSISEPAEEEAKSAKTSNPPKTENEVDGYKVPIQELESQLQIKLTVEGETETTMATKNGMGISMNEVSLAGKIKNYMILDRTVVVESITNSPVGPLDEGSLLIVKKSDSDCKDGSTTSWIPLGRIFEVFGPVSQPLYTIRLPSPPIKKKERQNDKTSAKGNAKVDEGKICETPTVDNAESNETAAAKTSTELSSSEATEVANGSEKETMSSDTVQSPFVEEKSTPMEEEGLKSVSKDGTTNDDESEASVIDPWAVDGEYAKFISRNKAIQVYYIQDEAKLIDTGLVLRTSGKGCDASNIYDEEIVDSSESYYSDDEKEREAKNKRKGATRKKKQQGNSNRYQSNQPRPRNFYQHNVATGQHQFRQNAMKPPPPPPPQSYAYGQHTGTLPSGFHRTTQQGGFQQNSSLYQYPVQSAFHGQSSVPPPPPPPPPMHHHQQQPYQRVAPSSQTHPPPPPPRNPNEPPAYQY